MPVHFTRSGSTWYVAYWNPTTQTFSTSSDPRHDTDLRFYTDGTYWYVSDQNDTIETYDSSGKLTNIAYKGGYQQSFDYDGAGNNTTIHDSLGRSLIFIYLANGLVDTLTAPNGVIHYSYQDRSGISPPPAPGNPGQWVLQSVTYPDSTSITYVYDDAHPINRFALTGLVDENSVRYATWGYDAASGRATSSQHAGGVDLTTIAYDDPNNERTVTNALGKQAIFNLATYQGVYQITSIAGQASAHCAASTVSYKYDENGFVKQRTSGEGRVNTYIHNSIGQETSRTEGDGSAVARTIATHWNPTWRAPDEIDQADLKINFYYDAVGRLQQLTETDTTTQSIPYSTNGQVRTWQFGYWPSGLLHTIDGPLPGTNDIVSYAYNSNGYVQSITDELGHTTQITAWSAWGTPLTSIDPNGVTTTYTYDGRGRLKTVTINPGANQSQSSIGYDLAGNVKTVTTPDGLSLTYNYDDAHQVSSIVDNLNEKISYPTRDALGDIKKTTIKTSTGAIVKSQTATFDELGRVLKNIGAASQTTQHGYDRDDNETQTIDPRNKIYGHAFDAINRLYQETDPDLFRTMVAYNAEDGITSVTDPRTLVTNYVRDGFGDAIQVTSPDTGTAVYYYDALGDVTKKLDARGVETDYTYDVKGRIKTRKIQGASAEDVTFLYDTTTTTNGINRLWKITDPSGSTAFVYDALGGVQNETRVIQSKTYSVGFSNDAALYPLTITYPSGRIVTYTRDALGRISGITTDQSAGSTAVTIASNTSYMPFGALSGFTFGNGVALTLGYDQDYQLTGIVAANGAATIQNLALGYDPAGDINPITDNLIPARSQTLGYDDLNRLNAATGLYGTEGYLYDRTGNRTQRTLGSTTESYAISPTSNQIVSITAGSNVRSFSYLPTGQASNDNRDPSHAYIYNYNSSGRLASAILNGGSATTYLINGLEQRVVKSFSSLNRTHYIYDRLGHLLAEANGLTGATLKEYIWLDDLPVAMVDNTGASPIIYYIHADHLGTPQKLTNGAGSVVWDGVFDPFGNPTSITGSVTLNLRFPGQYFDAETGLHQNWNRDYDPTIGRYVESDPIGLEGGINPYSYALGNPLRRTDRDGKGILGCIVGGTIGGLIGGSGGTIVEPGGGTVIGGIGGAEEGCDIGSGAEDALRLMQMASTFARQRAHDCPESDPDHCKKVHQQCHNECVDLYIGRGYGSDAPLLYRRCVRECMAAAGCHNY